MNEDGGFVVVTDESEAIETLQTEEGGYHCRVVKITVQMEPPKMEAVSVTVPSDAGKVEAQAS
jgi:hypothetical protein